MITLILLLIPLVSGIFLIWNKNTRLAKSIASLVGIVEVVLFIYAFTLYKANPANLDFSLSWVNDFKISFHLGVDGLSLVMLGLTVLGAAFINLATRNFSYDNISRVLGLVLISQAALVGTFTAKDAFVFYFFFEMALLPVYLIASLWGGLKLSKIALKMYIYTVLGSLLMFVGFVVLYLFAQTSDLTVLTDIGARIKPGISNILFWGFIIAFSIKAPLFPFHTWLPEAYSKSPTPATMLLAGLLSKMGIYGIIRIALPLAPAGVANYSSLIIFFSVVGLIYGSIIAIQQMHFKRLVAYSSFAHLCLMGAAVLTKSEFGLQGAIFQMVSHGFTIIGLFYVAKIIFDKTGTRFINELGGISQRAPKLAAIFMILMLANVGLPLTNGFVGEYLMLRSVFNYHIILGIVAITSIILSAIYLLRLYQKSMYGPTSSKTENIEDIGVSELVVLVPIVLIIVITGVFPNSILELSQGFVNTLTLVK